MSVFDVIVRKSDELGFSDVAIYLSESSGDEQGRTLLTPRLMSDGEIDSNIDFLIEQLENMRKKAKKKLHTMK